MFLTLRLIALGFLLFQETNAFYAPDVSVAPTWVHPDATNHQSMWGIRGGLMWAIQPDGFRARSEPRGLIRLGYPILTNGGYDLVNFIAIEPIVRGTKGFSELEYSDLDKKPGKRLWASDGKNNTSTNIAPGTLSTLSPGVEQLQTTVRIEPFQNGAKVRVVISQRSDAPNEIQLTIHAEPDSAPIEYCILTATMGNMARTRQLHLKDGIISSLKLYLTHRGDDFAPHTIYPLARLSRNTKGDIIVPFTNDETDPAPVYPFPGSRRWHYAGMKVTQYWKKAHDTFHDDLHAAVNARYTYWKTQTPIPGGVAFENVELRERFYEGQQFIFGITPDKPDQLISE
jgi:hypothetical protein